MTEYSDKYYDLIIRFMLGKTNPEEETLLSNWKKESAQNEMFFNATRDSFLASSVLKKNAAFSSEKGLKVLHQKMQPGKPKNPLLRKMSPTLRITAIAAVLILFFGLGSIFTRMVSIEPVAQKAVKVIAPIGSRAIANLPDGTQVWLNAGSEIYFTTAPDQTRLLRLKGEAFFKVKSDHKHPFIVQTKNLAIKAVGTSFNVKAYPDENKVITTLVEGVVKIERLGNKENSQVITMKPLQKVTIYQDQTLFIQERQRINAEDQHEKQVAVEINKQMPVIQAQNVNTELYTSWKDSRWIIEREEFGNLVVLLERRYNVNILITSNELKNYRFSGTFTNETVEQALSLMRYSIPFSYIIDRNNIILKTDPLLMKTYNQAYGRK